MAPRAQLVGVKVLDRNGAGTTSGVIAGIDWCVSHRDQLDIRVINLSLGHPVATPYSQDPLCVACEQAT